jgi:hypothetical protein
MLRGIFSPNEKLMVRHGNKGGQWVGRFATIPQNFLSLPNPG